MHNKDLSPISDLPPAQPQAVPLLFGVPLNGGVTLTQIHYPAYSDTYDLPSHYRLSGVYYVVSGILVISIDGHTMTLKPGDSGAIMPGSIGCTWNPSAAPGSLIVINLMAEKA
ncbi:MAG: hypothetical protein HC822_10230 [Oscillochloris sp.]|nr:hypothetical protein [Oscillochloris sp.]